MKKLIVTSIVTSAMLFAANVDGLDMSQENTISNTKINAAIVTQGKTEIWGQAEVEGLKITNKDKGNVIDDTLINGAANLDFTSKRFEYSEYYDRELDDSVVTQGSTKIINGKVSNLKIDSDSVINEGTTINTPVGNSVTIDQGFTLVSGISQELSDANIKSDNRISSVDIQGEGVGSTVITQAKFEMMDAGAGSSATKVNLDTTNVIEGGHIGRAKIKQAYTGLSNGAVVEDLTLVQENTISGESEIKDFSEISQGVVTVNNSKLTGLEQNVQNIITDVEGESSSAVDSSIVQSRIDVMGNSDVSLVQLPHTNTIQNTQLLDSSVKQDTVLANANSVIKNFSQESDSTIDGVVAENSTIVQNTTDVIHGTIDSRNASTSKQNNLVQNTDVTDAYLGQAMTLVRHSEVMDLTVSQENEVSDSSLHNSYVTQGELIVSNI